MVFRRNCFRHSWILVFVKPHHKITNNVTSVQSKHSYQPGHSLRVSRVSVVCSLASYACAQAKTNLTHLLCPVSTSFGCPKELRPKNTWNNPLICACLFLWQCHNRGRDRKQRRNPESQTSVWGIHVTIW